MASLLGLLGSIGDSIIGGDQPSYLTRLNNAADPEAAAQKQEAINQQQIQQSTLAALADMRQNNVTNPTQIISRLATINPQYAQEALKIPAYNLQQQQATNLQTQNDTQKNALAALADMRQSGITNPQQILNGLANVDPEYATKAATLQAQNPLAGLIQNGSQTGGVSGDDLLKSLPQSVASQVKAIADGKMQFPGGFAMKSPYWQQMLQLVGQYDPSFDAVNFNARAATRKDFTSGKSAQNITALNTAIGHISTLQDAATELDNTDYPTVNSIVNTVKNLTGSDKVKDFDTAKDAVSDELTRVFRGTGGSVSDVAAWKDKLSAANSPQQFQGVMNQMAELLNSRLDSLGQQYNQGMGTAKQGIELLSPKAQKAYAKITGSNAPETKVSGNMPVDNASQDPIEKAKAAGYSQEEIDAYLKKKGLK